MSAIKEFIQDVQQGSFPSKEESFTLKDQNIIDNLHTG
jgi:ketopantoate hydroxymethyltransferase